MVVYLLRHGIAANTGGKIKSDAARPLSSEGIAALAEETAGMRKLGLEIDAVWTSPLVRARQTARIVADAFQMSGKVVEIEALGIPASATGLLEHLRDRDLTSSIMLVGHQPDMGRLAGFLTGIDKLWLPFKKGGLCRIDVERLQPAPVGELKWFLTPKHLKLIGQS
jgi:phosphohistidine phosphatase